MGMDTVRLGGVGPWFSELQLDNSAGLRMLLDDDSDRDSRT